MGCRQTQMGSGHAPERAKCTQLDSAMIGPAGGSLRVPSSSASPLASAEVSFPPGALGQKIQLRLSWCRRDIELRVGSPSGVVVKLMAEGDVTRFHAPVTFDLPTPNIGSNMPIPYQVDDEGQLHLVQLISYSLKEKRMIFQIFGPGSFSWSR